MVLPPPKSVALKEQDQDELRVPDVERRSLLTAIKVYGESTTSRAINKSVSVKEKACVEINDVLGSYDEVRSRFKPTTMLRGTSEIAARLIRDKMWPIFNQGVNIALKLYDHFVYAHPVPKKELASSVQATQKELFARGCDTNPRVQDKAELTLQKMISNKKIFSNTDVLQTELVAPLPTSHKQSPKAALFKSELVKYLIFECPEHIGKGSITVPALTQFGLSAVENSSSPVRCLGEKIIVKLYQLNPGQVRKVMPPDNPRVRKNSHGLRNLFETFEKMDKEHSERN